MKSLICDEQILQDPENLVTYQIFSLEKVTFQEPRKEAQRAATDLSTPPFCGIFHREAKYGHERSHGQPENPSWTQVRCGKPEIEPQSGYRPLDPAVLQHFSPRSQKRRRKRRVANFSRPKIQAARKVSHLIFRPKIGVTKVVTIRGVTEK